jgi:hypothetical protein
MRTFRKVVQSLSTMPRGFNADGRALGLGLHTALQVQRANGADVQPLRTAKRPVHTDAPYSRAS